MHVETKLKKKISIKNMGKDKYWLQDIINANPEKLGLGKLVTVRKKKQQTSEESPIFLLKDPSNNTIYAVEIMIGKTNPSHIIRSIECWDNEKSKYLKKRDFAVLMIAESFDKRYFDVIELLSANIPMIAIKAELLEIENEKILNFTKVPLTEKTWREKAPWTLETAKKHLEVLAEIEKDIELKFTQDYISIVISGENTYQYNNASSPTSHFWFNVKEEKANTIIKLYEKRNIDHGYTIDKDIVLRSNIDFIENNIELIKKIHVIKTKAS